VAARIAARAVRALAPADGACAGGGAPAAGSLWVSAWVDYSSKYGVGYMLSNAAVGVYFNDSTKAVLAPDGSTFEYVERHNHGRAPPQTKLADCPSAVVVQGGDGIFRIRATLARFPAELAKKVTLLKHFQATLLEDFRSRAAATAAAGGAGAGGGGGLRAPPPMPAHVAPDGELPAAAPDAEAMTADGRAVNGGALVFVGADEARLRDGALASVRLLSREAMDEDGPAAPSPSSSSSLERAPLLSSASASAGVGAGAGAGGAPLLPFVKKYIRSRRCMMFRLSTRAVHIFFYDGTQLLLAGEGRRAVYTDRGANRFAFATADLLAARTALGSRAPPPDAASARFCWTAPAPPGTPGTEEDWLRACLDALRRLRYAKESIGSWASMNAAPPAK
jgi:hypothetical protein